MASTNVDKDKIEIVFDELVNVKDAFSNVVVSPTASSVPKVSTSGHKVIVSFQDTLEPNTTYTIDFGNSIEDINEGNKINNFAYWFSTGETIDTLQISGMVLDSRTLEPQQSVLVGIHSNPDDTCFIRKRLERVAKTDDKGRFTIRGIKPGNYRVYSLGDINNDFKWDNPEENIAFMDTQVSPWAERGIVTDTIFNLKTGEVDSIKRRERTMFYPNDILLNSFNINYKSQYLVKNERLDSTRISLIFNAPQKHLPNLSVVGAPGLTEWYKLERNANSDSLIYWIKPKSLIQTDTLRISINYERTDTAKNLVWGCDTLRLITARQKTSKQPASKKKEKKDTISTPEIRMVNIKPLTGATQEVYSPVIIEFDEPIEHFDKSKWHLSELVDSLIIPVKSPPIIEKRDSLSQRHISITYPWQFEKKYKLEADSLAVETLYGLTNKKFEYSFTTRKEEEYTHLKLNISGLEDGIPAFVELLNSSDNPVRTAIVDATGTAVFKYLLPGTYYARIVEDANGNGIYDTGSFEPPIQPEATAYYPKKLSLKAGWDREESWNINEIPLDKQKPYEIKKNKSESDKKRSSTNKDNSETDEDEDEDEYFDPTSNPFDPNEKTRRKTSAHSY
jgi:hypothetical protein